MVKPTDSMEWASSGAAQITEPLEAKKDAGWIVGEKPPAQYFNWWMNNAYLWQQYFEEVTDTLLAAGDPLSSTTDLTLTIDSDGNSTTNALILKHNNPGVEIFRVDEDGDVIATGDISAQGNVFGDNIDASNLTNISKLLTYAQITLLPGTFNAVGSPSAAVGGGAGMPISISAMTSTLVALTSDTLLRAYQFNGSTWAMLGSSLTITGAGSIPGLAALNATDIAYLDNTLDELRTYRFNGSTWAQVGSGLSMANTTGGVISALNSTDIAIVRQSELVTYRFNGSTWAIVGSALAVATTGVVTALNSTDVAFFDETTDLLRAYRFNGSTWSALGSTLSIVSGTTSITAMTSTDIAHLDHTNDSLRVYRFNGSTWAQVGTGKALATAAPSITALSSTSIVWVDVSVRQLQVYSYADLPALGPVQLR